MMDCANCQRLTDDLTSLTIAFKNLKKWMHEKLEIRIPQCLDFPVDNVQVEVDERRLSHNLSLPAACLETDKRLVIKLERLPATMTTTTATQSQGSEPSTDGEDMFYNDDQNLELKFEASRGSILSQNNFGEDGLINGSQLDLLDSENNFNEDSNEIENSVNNTTRLSLLPIIPYPNRMSSKNKKPSSILRMTLNSKKKVPNVVKSYKSRDLKKDSLPEAETTKSNIKTYSTYFIDDNYIEPRRKSTESTLKKNQSLKCSICSKSKFSTQLEYKLHLTSHDFSLKFQCSNCSARFFGKHRLQDHYQFCTRKKRYVCSNCKRRFTLERKVKKHILLPCSPIIVKKKNKGPFKCPLPNCYKVIKSKNRLREHMKYSVLHRKHPPRPKPKKYKCEHCKLRISSAAGLANHTKRCLKIKDILCPDCGKFFSTEVDLRIHMRLHKATLDHECQICHKNRKYTKESLRRHIRFLHPKDPKSLLRICPFCAMTFKDKYSLEGHLKSIHNDDHTELKKCSFTGCNKEFYWEYQLKTHVKSHSEDIDVTRPFKCTVDEKCEKIFNRHRDLKCHISIFHKKKDQAATATQEFVCQNEIDNNGVREQCCAKFSKFSTLKRHNYSVHNQQYEFKCTFDGCIQSFTQERYLFTHLKCHEKPRTRSKKIFLTPMSRNQDKSQARIKNINKNKNVQKCVFKEKECPICLKKVNVSRNSSNFNKHMQYVHERPYSCSFDNCDNKSHKSKALLGLHVKKHHPDHFKPEDYPAPKEYSCGVCNRTFYHRENLIQHKTVHVEIRKFGCEFCNLKFKRKPDVRSHVQAVHSGLKPFVCDYENCGKAFALKYYLKSHVSSVHLGKSRYRLKKK